MWYNYGGEDNLLPKLLNSKEVQEYLHIGNDALYELLNDKNFPSFRVRNGEYKILEDDFLAWMREKSKKQSKYLLRKNK